MSDVAAAAAESTTGPGPGAHQEAGPGGGPEAGAKDDADWRRLDRRSLLVTVQMTGGVVTAIGVPITLSFQGWVAMGPVIAWAVGLSLLLIASGVGLDALRLRHSRYRVGPDRAELRSGILFAKHRSLSRDRIRSVDLVAHPLLRLLGLVEVRIGTGEQSAGQEATLELRPVRRAEGERLRRELLSRAAKDGASDAQTTLAFLDPRWIRYAPLSFVTSALAAAAGGAVMQVSEWFGVQEEVIEWVGDVFRGMSVTGMVLALIAVGLAAGSVGALGLWIEMWWNYRLEREPGGTLRVRRGLFTTRSISLEEARLRGVDVVEPLGLRLSGAARVDAVATGLSRRDEEDQAGPSTLLPAAPRRLADGVAAQVLRERVTPTATELAPHPRAARSRRIRWAVSAALAPALVLLLLGVLLDVRVLTYLGTGTAVVLVPVAVALACDAYRSLGHALDADYLVVRSGTLRRSTVALRRGGVIGWTVKQSVLQRRAGLVTLSATTAAGAQAYAAYDVGEAEGLEFAERAVPGLLAPFLERRDG
ncbi:PH domain-containing protein [Streptomyces atriruber]|uniref:PH domain-containing protein n=1 Tax=Streptomyces atriruber TaxID=545121 RepID=UPI003F54055D